MTSRFLIKALPKESSHSLMQKSDEELKLSNALWLTVDTVPGYPCRVSLSEAKIGERVLALPFCHDDVSSPYRASGPIFVHENAESISLGINEIPNTLRHRLLSVRSYNADKIMIVAETLHGKHIETAIDTQFEKVDVNYIHIHNANPGCFSCSVHSA